MGSVTFRLSLGDVTGSEEFDYFSILEVTLISPLYLV